MLNKQPILLAIVLSSVLFGCADKEAAPAAQESTGTATESTETTTTAALPKPCEDYFATVDKLIAKAPAEAVETYKQQVEQARSQWSAMADQSQLTAACEQANTQMEQVLKSMPQ